MSGYVLRTGQQNREVGTHLPNLLDTVGCVKRNQYAITLGWHTVNLKTKTREWSHLVY